MDEDHILVGLLLLENGTEHQNEVDIQKFMEIAELLLPLQAMVKSRCGDLIEIDDHILMAPIAMIPLPEHQVEQDM